jgi:hypothetical protein
LHFLPQVSAIGLTRGPSFSQVGLVRLQFALKTRIRRSFRKASGLEIAADGRAGDVKAFSNLLLQCTCLMQREYLLIASQTLRTPLLLHAYAIRVARPLHVRQRQGYRSQVIIIWCGNGRLHLELVGLLCKRLSSHLSNVDHLLQDLLDGGAQVLHEVKAVGDLNRIWRSLPCTFSKRAGTVARDDLKAGMSLEPGGEGGGTGVGK